MTGIESLMEIGEDAGVSAVFESLKRLGVARYDHPAMAWKFIEVTLSDESLVREIARRLGRA